MDGISKRPLFCVCGKRNVGTVRKLYERFSHLKDCKFFTDEWKVFAKIIPEEKHFAGKEFTTSIEQNNSNTRNDVGRFIRRTKIVSKSIEMVENTMKLWVYLEDENNFKYYRDKFLSI